MIGTFISIKLDSLEKRFKEIDILLLQAKENISDQDSYKALCRSAHILLVAHFEGTIKDIIKDVLEDLNHYIDFKEVPENIKRTFSEYYMKHENGIYNEKLRKRLIETFEDLPIKLKPEPFYYENNKNPSPYILETYLKRFGKKEFLKSIATSDLDIVFENNKSETMDLLQRIKYHLKNGVNNYPYNVNSKIYNPKTLHNLPKNLKSMWETFLDELLLNRHNIVHGSILDNPTDHEEISIAKNKIEILIYVFIIELCNCCIPEKFRNSNCNLGLEICVRP